MAVYGEVYGNDLDFTILEDGEVGEGVLSGGGEEPGSGSGGILGDELQLPGILTAGRITPESIPVFGVDVTGLIATPLQGTFAVPGVRTSGAIQSGSRIEGEDLTLPGIRVAGFGGAESFLIPGIRVSGAILAGGVVQTGDLRLPPVSVAGELVSEGLLAHRSIGFSVGVSGAILTGTAGFGLMTLPGVRASGEVLAGAILSGPSLTLPGVGLTGFFYEDVRITSGTIKIPVTVSGTIFGPAVGAAAATGHALSLNTRTLALTRYTGYRFNSFAEFKGVALAAASDGIHVIGGDTDAGTAIPATIKTGLLNFGVKSAVRVRSMYVSYRATAPVRVVTSVDDIESNVYGLPPTRVSGVYRNRVKFGRGAKGQYWQFTIESDGGAFSIDQIEFEAEALSRRVA